MVAPVPVVAPILEYPQEADKPEADDGLAGLSSLPPEVMVKLLLLYVIGSPSLPSNAVTTMKVPASVVVMLGVETEEAAAVAAEPTVSMGSDLSMLFTIIDQKIL